MDTFRIFNVLGTCAWEDTVSLPPVGGTHAQPCEILKGEALDAWNRWREVLLRSPAEHDAAVQREGAGSKKWTARCHVEWEGDSGRIPDPRAENTNG